LAGTITILTCKFAKAVQINVERVIGPDLVSVFDRWQLLEFSFLETCTNRLRAEAVFA
jgi:hypothetical protein